MPEILGDQSQIDKPKKTRSVILKRRLWAIFLGVTIGVGAVEADRHLTKGLITTQVRNLVVNPDYRNKVWESLASGEIVGDVNDLIREALNQASQAPTVEQDGVAPFEPSQFLGETLQINDVFLETYFENYEIRVVSGIEATINRPVYIAQIDNAQIVDFNSGTEEQPLYDPWETAEDIGAFSTIPTNQSEPTSTGERTHAFYSSYYINGQVVEYLDITFAAQDRDPRMIRAGALVLFSKDNSTTLVALDSRDFNLEIGDLTPNGTVVAIESFGAAISSANEAEDIQSLQQLKGEFSSLLEYSRKNYEATVVTYSFEDGTTQTYAFGLYTNPATLPPDVTPWPIEQQLSPQDFYSLVKEYGRELNATGCVMLLTDPGPSSFLYDPQTLMGDTERLYYSEPYIRPRYSLVQLGE